VRKSPNVFMLILSNRTIGLKEKSSFLRKSELSRSSLGMIHTGAPLSRCEASIARRGVSCESDIVIARLTVTEGYNDGASRGIARYNRGN